MGTTSSTARAVSPPLPWQFKAHRKRPPPVVENFIEPSSAWAPDHIPLAMHAEACDARQDSVTVSPGAALVADRVKSSSGLAAVVDAPPPQAVSKKPQRSEASRCRVDAWNMAGKEWL